MRIILALLILTTLSAPISAPAAPLCRRVAELTTQIGRNVTIDILKPSVKTFDASRVYQKDETLREDFKDLASAKKSERHAIISRIESDLRLKAATDEQAVREQRAYEVPLLIIGGGAHSAIVRLAASQSGLQTVTLEAGATLSAQVFGGGPDVFTLNTYPEATLLPGSPVQMPYFSRATYPDARDLHDTIIAAHGAAAGRLLLGTKVRDGGVSLRPDGRYDVVTENGLSFVAKVVVTSTGLSKPVTIGAAPAQKAINDFRLQTLAHDVSRFQYFDDYLLETQRAPGHYDANEPYDDKIVAVIGRGPSANVAIENLFGHGPSQLYAGSSKTHWPKKVIWINGFATRAEFIKSNIKRYHNETFSDALWRNDRFEVVQGHVENAELLSSGRLRVYLRDGGSVDIDAAIAATGYRIGVKELMSDEQPLAALKLAPVTINKNGKSEIVGRRLEPYANIYAVGASAGPFITPEQAALRPVAVRNPVNLPFTAWRTEAIAKQIVGDLIN